MAEKRTGPSRRTQAERDVINKRAAAQERPISSWQIEALRCMAKRPLTRGKAGWATDLLPGRYWQGQTIRALADRGLCSLGGGKVGRERFARLSPKGRKALISWGYLPVGSSRRHAWGWLPR